MNCKWALNRCLSDLLEGDIRLEDVASSRVSVNKKIYLWSGGIVPYVFDSGLSTHTFTICLFNP